MIEAVLLEFLMIKFSRKFVRLNGIETSNTEEDRFPKVDFELFMNKMKHLRGWTEARSKEE